VVITARLFTVDELAATLRRRGYAAERRDVELLLFDLSCEWLVRPDDWGGWRVTPLGWRAIAAAKAGESPAPILQGSGRADSVTVTSRTAPVLPDFL
jgi:hypothetical protein